VAPSSLILGRKPALTKPLSVENSVLNTRSRR
jgi:hypothetical protein